MICDDGAGALFAIGMFVRIPFTSERMENEFRDFRIGQIRSINDIAGTALIHLDSSLEGEPSEIECLLSIIERCRILPDTPFTTMYVKRTGRILIHCCDEWIPGQFLDYYVLFDGERETRRLSEAEIRVSSMRQNPDPAQQLRHYEFHNPIWKSVRDRVIDSYSTLRNATFGIEDLVGSRIMLLSHQAEVVAKALSDVDCRYILADEVGLGKTIEACVILKGLLRRNKKLQTLIIAPSSLIQQWHNELNTKFWLNFPVLRSDQNLPTKLNGAGYIIAVEDLAFESELWLAIQQISWGLLIVDEAHRLKRLPTLYQRVRLLSDQAKRALILSATPIQRYAKEYLKLLSLLYPQRFNPEDVEAFKIVLAAQAKIRRKVASLAQNLNPDDFDAEEFGEGIEAIVKALKHDHLLPKLVARVSEQSHYADHGLQAAQEVLAYVSENYRIENRVIRNRRAHLQIQLPERKLDTSYRYRPGEEEQVALETLYDYIDAHGEYIEENQLTAEYCRILMHAAASSPHALLHLLEMRSMQLTIQEAIPVPPEINLSLITSASPRQEAERIAQVVAEAPSIPGEKVTHMETLLWRVKRWLEQTDRILMEASSLREDLAGTAINRLAQVIKAIDKAMKARNGAKVIVFSAWMQTLAALLPALLRKYGSAMVAQFTAQVDIDKLQDVVTQFQSSDRCRILLCDELGGEGRNFQVANQIIHIDLPWTPAQLEQRIGRVDRFGREGTVMSIVPFAEGFPEHDLFRIWQDAFQLFTHSMSGLEIALETIQDTLMEAILQSSREGLAQVIQPMVERAEKLRVAVEEERYFEEAAVNRSWRNEFEKISSEYSDGKKMAIPVLQWAELAGLTNEYDSTSDIVTFIPRRFNETMMKNARFLQPPDMQEALRRSGRTHDLVIRGTFNRNIAVRLEKLVFFASSSDEWTNALITNALEADIGRSCAIKRRVLELKGNWEGFELLYSLAINPRPLYAGGYESTHLLRSLGFLRMPLYRILISTDGQLQSKSSAIWKMVTKQKFQQSTDIHLGRREAHGSKSGQLQAFKEEYPAPEWHELLRVALKVAEAALDEELAFMADEAADARVEFARRAFGWRSAHQWFKQAGNDYQGLDEQYIEEYERVSAALVEGIRQPIRQLESACFWILEGGAQA